MKYIKTYENKFEFAQRKAKMISDAIVDLFQHENIDATSNYFEEENTFMCEIIIDNGELAPIKTLFQIEHFFTEPLVMITSFNSYNEDINNFIKHVAEDFKSIDYFTTTHWSITIDLNKISEIVEKLSVKNFEIYTEANKYNL